MKPKRFIAALLSLVLTFGFTLQLAAEGRGEDDVHDGHYDCECDHGYSFHESASQDEIEAFLAFARDFQAARNAILFEILNEAGAVIPFAAFTYEDFVPSEEQIEFILDAHFTATRKALESFEISAVSPRGSLCCPWPWPMHFGTVSSHVHIGNVCVGVDVVDFFTCFNCGTTTSENRFRPGCGPNPRC